MIGVPGPNLPKLQSKFAVLKDKKARTTLREVDIVDDQIV